MTQEELQMIREYLDKSRLSAEETAWLLEHREEVLKYASRQFIVETESGGNPPSDKALQGWQTLEAILEARDREEAVVVEMDTRRNRWWWYAAAVIALVCTAFFWVIRNDSVERMVIRGGIDRAPGGNMATLQLADGRIISLDSTAEGLLATEGAASISKTDDGEIVYTLGGNSKGPLVYNTLSTPLGGQHQLVLPDGTRVWLNAGSSITYPVEFTGRERRVKTAGELYFEVVPHSGKPFIVETAEVEVQVLGTSFNINNYSNEERVNTTLINGAVNVLRRGAANGESPVRLYPGQQASVEKAATSGVEVRELPAVQQVVAWKDGLFDFEGADLRSVMRQLERWYKIEVRYTGAVENVKFRGSLYRNTNLSEVLNVLTLMDVKFKMEGNILYVIN